MTYVAGKPPINLSQQPLSGPLVFADGSTQYTAARANRNLIVDGQFEQWTTTAGIALSPTGAYTSAVMYFGTCGAGGAGTTQASIPPGTRNWNWPAGMTSPVTGAMGFNQTTASTGSVAGNNAPNLSQRLEGGNTLAGRSGTFSCWLWVGSGSITIPSIVLRQNFGTGGSPSAANILDKTVNWVVTTQPTRFSVRLDLPSVTSATFGTNGDDKVSIGLWLPPGVTFTLFTAQWQLEESSPGSSGDLTGKGGSPSAFDYRGYQAEMARVQRHYYASYPPGTAPGTPGVATHIAARLSAGTDTFIAAGNVSFPAMMRAIPALSVYSPNSGASAKVYNTGGAADVAGFIPWSSQFGAMLSVNNVSVGATTTITSHLVADARL